MSRYLPKKVPYKAIVFQALVITVLFHIALLYSFTYRPGLDKRPVSRQRHITLLNLDRTSGPINSETLRRWLIYHNPELFARPDYRYGYGAIVKNSSIRPPLADSDYNEPPSEILPLPGKFTFLKADQEPAVDYNSRLVDYATLGVRPLPPLKFQHHSYPLVKLSDGRYLDGILTNEELQYRNLALTGRERATRLMVLPPASPDMMPRVVLVQSCGNNQLDRLAIQKLLLNRTRLYPDKAAKNGYLAVEVIWHEVRQ